MSSKIPKNPIKLDGVTFDWKDDSKVSKCEECERDFTFSRRKHHCRACGGVFCDTDCKVRKDERNTRYCVGCYGRILTKRRKVNAAKLGIDIKDEAGDENVTGNTTGNTGNLSAPSVARARGSSVALDLRTVEDVPTLDAEVEVPTLSASTAVPSVTVEAPSSDGFFSGVTKFFEDVFKKESITVSMDSLGSIGMSFQDEQKDEDVALDMTQENSVRLKQLKNESKAYEPNSFLWDALVAFFSIGLFLVGGAVFYHLFHDWSMAFSLFYAIQAAFTVGFDHVNERDSWSLVFTSLYVIASSCVLAVIFGRYVTTFLHKRDANRRFGPASSDVSFMYAAAAFLSFGGAGMAIGVYIKEWSALRSIYFAVTTMTTSGLQPPDVETDHNPPETLLLCLYILVAIPVFYYCLSQLAEREVEKFEENYQEVERIRGNMEYTMCLNELNHKTELDRYEFMKLAIVRTGLVNRKKFAAFESLIEAQENGKFSKLTMHGSFAFSDVMKVNAAGEELVNKHQFVQLTDNLGLFKDHTDARDLFKELDVQNTGHISRIQFLDWYVPARLELNGGAPKEEETKSSSTFDSLSGMASSALSGVDSSSLTSMAEGVEMKDLTNASESIKSLNIHL